MEKNPILKNSLILSLLCIDSLHILEKIVFAQLRGISDSFGWIIGLFEPMIIPSICDR
jgi:hypothetical protein